MINRTVWRCDSCSAKTIVRIGFGHGDVQRHSFACPHCGIEIEVVLNLDQKNASWSYGPAKNATYDNGEDDAVAVRTFYPGTMVPDRNDQFVSPFVETILKVENLEQFRRDESWRHVVVHQLWPKLERAHIHFERDDAVLFDRELATFLKTTSANSRAQRADRLAFVTQRALSAFTHATDGQRGRVRQRLTLASHIDRKLMSRVAETWLSSGRLASLWMEIKRNRAAALNAYPFYRPLLQMTRYWHEQRRSLADFVLPDKGVDVLKRLFIDTYETLCRLVVLVVAVEAIIHHRTLDIPTAKGSMSLELYDAMKNGIKPNILVKYPIADLFVPAMDSSLRNGIGHNAASFDAAADEIVYRATKGEVRLSYTRFCARVLDTYTAFELATKYFHVLHGVVEGKLA